MRALNGPATDHPPLVQRNVALATFEPLFASLSCAGSTVTERKDGIAFLRVAKDLYGIDCIIYFCINIPAVAGLNKYSHCIYSDSRVMHCLSRQVVNLNIVERAGLSTTVYRELQNVLQTLPWGFAPGMTVKELRGMTLPLGSRAGESAFLAIAAEVEPSRWESQQILLSRELRVLANYFHSHILRINGCDSETEMLISAKELDCLKWTAAGKTAWEASVILGISERTVRFHLNMAREKLGCANTTQAVAKAVARQLIDVEHV